MVFARDLRVTIIFALLTNASCSTYVARDTGRGGVIYSNWIANNDEASKNKAIAYCVEKGLLLSDITNTSNAGYYRFICAAQNEMSAEDIPLCQGSCPAPRD